MDLLRPSLDMADLGDADLIIEAVFESMDVKRDVFAKLDAIAKPGALLASNTSYLDVDEIASFTKRPGDVLGMHFFSPANVMRLLEVVQGDKTDAAVLRTALDVGRKLARSALSPGFAMGSSATICSRRTRRKPTTCLRTALPWEIDAAMTDFGSRWGHMPSAIWLVSISGTSTGGVRMRRGIEQRYVAIADTLYEMDRLGQKTGAGWYRYEEGSRRGQPDPVVEDIILKASGAKGIQRRAFSAEEIRGRALAALVNEGAKILEEGIAARPVDIDMVWLFGYGFPSYEGGPMFWADRYGLAKLASEIEEFAKEDPRFWAIAPLLKQLADQGSTFKQWSDAR